MDLHAFVRAHFPCRAFRSSDPEPEALAGGLARWTVTCAGCEESIPVTLPISDWLDLIRELIEEFPADLALEAARRLSRLPTN